MIESLIPALIPVLSDGVRGVFNRLTGGAGSKPANTEETIALMKVETERLRALGELDAVTGASVWVNNIRGLQRPLISLVIVSTYAGAVILKADNDVITNIGVYAQMVTFYLFGDRTYMYIKKG